VINAGRRSISDFPQSVKFNRFAALKGWAREILRYSASPTGCAIRLAFPRRIWKSISPDEVRFMRSDIVPGALFPDYELPDQSGTPHKLSELQGPDPMILVLSRGGF
jgi:hypothetical protein